MRKLLFSTGSPWLHFIKTSQRSDIMKKKLTFEIFGALKYINKMGDIKTILPELQRYSLARRVDKTQNDRVTASQRHFAVFIETKRIVIQ